MKSLCFIQLMWSISTCLPQGGIYVLFLYLIRASEGFPDVGICVCLRKTDGWNIIAEAEIILQQL